MANEALLDRLADVYQQGFSRIQIAAEQAAQDAWFSLDTFAGGDEDEWTEAFWLIVSAAGLAAAGMAVAYLQAQLDVEGVDAILPDPDSSWFEDDFQKWKTSPMIAARKAISEGLDPVEAMAAAATRVTDVTTAAIRTVEQRTIDRLGLVLEDVDTPAPRVGQRPRRVRTRYRRITQEGACGFCIVAADRLYTSVGASATVDGHLMGAWHNYCRCSWRKLTDQEAASWESRLAGGEWRTVIKQRFQETGE